VETETQVQEQTETPPVASPLALRTRDDAPLVVFTEEKRRLIREQICPQGISDGEFEVFMLQCIRSGLDPLLKQAFCVPRKLKVKEKQRGPNGGLMVVDVDKEVFVFQPAVAGMLARAEQFPDYRGTVAACFYEGDEVIPDAPNGMLKHIAKNMALPASKRGKLLGAWAMVARQGRIPVVVVRFYEECVQTNYKGEPMGLWRSHAEMMMLKCPQAAALRLAFPAAFAGLYDAAEGALEIDGKAADAVPQARTYRPPPGIDAPAQETSEEAAGIEDGEIVPPEAQPEEPGADDLLSPADEEREAAEYLEREKARVMERLQACTDLAGLKKVAEEELLPLDPKHPVRLFLSPLYQELYDKFGGVRPQRRSGR
jgi:phage recombination protein Bet